MSKTDVNGEEANEVFRYLRRSSRLYDSTKDETRVIPWNFTKFIVNLETGQVTYLNPRTKNEELRKHVVYNLEGGDAPAQLLQTVEDEQE